MLSCSHSVQVLCHSSSLSSSHLGALLLTVLKKICSVVQAVAALPAPLQPDPGQRAFHEKGRAETMLQQLEDFSNKGLLITEGNHNTNNLNTVMLPLESDQRHKTLVTDPFLCKFLSSCLWSSWVREWPAFPRRSSSVIVSLPQSYPHILESQKEHNFPLLQSKGHYSLLLLPR